MVPNAFIFVEFYGSEQFSDQNPQNFGVWGKVLPVRDQKRSERENHLILESTTETCSKHDFSMIFVGYSSRIFSDFDGFPQISQFLHTALTASTRRIGSKCVHFRGFGWFCLLWLEHYFVKYNLDVLDFSLIFCEVFIEGFRRFSGISAFLHVFACTIERFQDAIGFKWRSFFMEFHIDPINFELKISKISY